MKTEAQALQPSQSYTRAVTNLWKNEQNLVKKIIKFVGSFFAYIFTLPLDAVTKIAKYFVNEDKTPKSLKDRFTDFAIKGKDTVVKFATNNWGKIALGVVAIGIGYQFNIHSKVTNIFSSNS